MMVDHVIYPCCIDVFPTFPHGSTRSPPRLCRGRHIPRGRRDHGDRGGPRVGAGKPMGHLEAIALPSGKRLQKIMENPL